MIYYFFMLCYHHLFSSLTMTPRKKQAWKFISFGPLWRSTVPRTLSSSYAQCIPRFVWKTITTIFRRAGNILFGIIRNCLVISGIHNLQLHGNSQLQKTVLNIANNGTSSLLRDLSHGK